MENGFSGQCPLPEPAAAAGVARPSLPHREPGTRTTTDERTKDRRVRTHNYTGSGPTDGRRRVAA